MSRQTFLRLHGFKQGYQVVTGHKDTRNGQKRCAKKKKEKSVCSFLVIFMSLCPYSKNMAINKAKSRDISRDIRRDTKLVPQRFWDLSIADMAYNNAIIL